MNTTTDPIAHLRDVIRRFHFSVQLIGYGECSVPGCDCEPEAFPWAYTVGLVEADLPELVLMGLDLRQAHAIVNHVGAALLDRRAPPVPGTELELVGRRLRLAAVPHEWLAADTARMAAWLEYYVEPGMSVRSPDVLQVLWADEHGSFPDDPGSVVSLEQPVLSLNPLPFPPRPDHLIRRARPARRRM